MHTWFPRCNRKPEEARGCFVITAFLNVKKKADVATEGLTTVHKLSIRQEQAAGEFPQEGERMEPFSTRETVSKWNQIALGTGVTVR